MMRSLYVVLGFWLMCVQTMAQSKPKKVLFVIVDGIPADVIEKQPTPNLDAIAKLGGYHRAFVGGEKGTYSQTPTISAVGYNSLLTGTWVNKHNVWDNDIKDPNYQYWTAFRFWKDQFPAKKTAVFSTWLDNRTKLVGENLPQTNHLRLTYSFDGLELDTLHFPHDKNAEYIHRIDETVVDEAARCLRQNSPDLMWVYLEYTDDMGHRYGDSEEFYRAVRLMDAQIGRLWQAIRARQQQGDDWQIWITTDHGRTAADGKHHGGQSERERTTWLVTNAQNLNAQFKTNPAIVDILPTMARHVGLTFPKEQAFELDGVPLTGPLSLTDMSVSKTGTAITVRWKPQQPNETISVWVSATNNFKTGGSDRYILMGTVPAKTQTYTFDAAKLPTGFYKIVLEGQHNSLTKWIVEK